MGTCWGHRYVLHTSMYYHGKAQGLSSPLVSKSKHQVTEGRWGASSACSPQCGASHCRKLAGWRSVLAGMSARGSKFWRRKEGWQEPERGRVRSRGWGSSGLPEAGGPPPVPDTELVGRDLGSAHLAEPLHSPRFPLPGPCSSSQQDPVSRKGRSQAAWRVVSESHQGKPAATLRFQTLFIQRGLQPREGQRLTQSYTASGGRARTTPQTLGPHCFHWHPSLILGTIVIIITTTI